MTAVGFEPTPLRTGAWSQRLRPLGQTVLIKWPLLLDGQVLCAPTHATPRKHFKHGSPCLASQCGTCVELVCVLWRAHIHMPGELRSDGAERICAGCVRGRVTSPAEMRPQNPWVHSSVARAADCRSAGPWFKSGCALLFLDKHYSIKSP